MTTLRAIIAAVIVASMLVSMWRLAVLSKPLWRDAVSFANIILGTVQLMSFAIRGRYFWERDE